MFKNNQNQRGILIQYLICLTQWIKKRIKLLIRHKLDILEYNYNHYKLNNLFLVS